MSVDFGDRIEKDFGEFGVFKGVVIEINLETDTQKKLYKVRYEDGDSEDFYLEELLPLLRDSKKRTAPRSTQSPPVKKAATTRKPKPSDLNTIDIPVEQFYVVVRRHSVGGCTDKEEAVYDDQERALVGARRARSREPAFSGWAKKKFGETPPPWSSREGPGRSSTDVYTEIFIESSVDRITGNSSELQVPGTSPPTHLGYDPNGTIVIDDEIFERFPASEVLQGRRCPVSNFPEGYVHFMKRLSDMCHSVAAFCRDPLRGARYQIHKYPSARGKSIVWLPPIECGLGGSLAPPKESIVDTLHTDLVDDKTGNILLTAGALMNACSKATKTLFVNSFEDDVGLAKAIRCCGNLECVVFVECRVGENTLSALHEKAKHLKGLHLHLCTLTPELDTESVGDIAFATVLKSAKKLIWFGCDLTRLGDTAGLGRAAWSALPPSCQVLVFEASWSLISNYTKDWKNGRDRLLSEMSEEIYKACRCCPNLGLVLVQRNSNGISCIIPKDN